MASPGVKPQANPPDNLNLAEDVTFSYTTNSNRKLHKNAGPALLAFNRMLAAFADATGL